MSYPSGPRPQPGVVIAAAVLAYISAGFDLLGGLFGMILGGLFSSVSAGSGGPLILISLAMMAAAGFLIAGGVRLQRGVDRRTLIGTLVITTFLFAIINIMLGTNSASGGNTLCTLLISLPWPIVTIYLATRPAATQWVESGGSYRSTGGGYVPAGHGYSAGGYPTTSVAPAQSRPVGPWILRDAGVTRALAEYGRRDLTGQPLWVPETTTLTVLRDAIATSQGTLARSALIAELERVAQTSPWHAVGAWRFVSSQGQPSWRRTELPGQFTAAVRTLLNDPAAPAITYRFDEFEADLVRRTEPPDSPLWSLVPVRPSDLQPNEPPAIGAEPPVADLAAQEQRLLANLGPNRLLATRAADGGYLAILLRVGAAEPATEVFAQAATLTGLLRATGDRLGQNLTQAVVSGDLAPYLRWRHADRPSTGTTSAPAPPTPAPPD